MRVEFIAAIPMQLYSIANGHAIPLDLAYATAVHKSQGLTLPLVSTGEKGHLHSAVVFCPAFERATFRETEGATPPR